MHWIEPRGQSAVRVVGISSLAQNASRGGLGFLIAVAAAVLVAGISLLGIVLCVLLFQPPSWVSVVNKSRGSLEHLVVITEPDRHQCDSLAIGDTFTVAVKPVDSKYVNVSFTCDGVQYTYPDCGVIDAFGEQRTVTVIGVGESIALDFGSVGETTLFLKASR
jgi:hypothetical protein